jgi:hypothetical protein
VLVHEADVRRARAAFLFQHVPRVARAPRALWPPGPGCRTRGRRARARASRSCSGGNLLIKT